MGQVAAPAPAGTSQRRSLVAAIAAQVAANLALAVGMLGLTRDQPEMWVVAAIAIGGVGQVVTSWWQDRVGRTFERRDARRFGFRWYSRRVLGRWAWVQAFWWLSAIAVLGAGAFAFVFASRF